MTCSPLTRICLPGRCLRRKSSADEVIGNIAGFGLFGKSGFDDTDKS